MITPRLLLSASFALTCLALSAPLRADEIPPAKRAIELGRAGIELFQKGKWQEAREQFEAADRLSHSPVFGLYMARTLANQGRLLAARTAYRAMVGEAVPDGAPSPWKQAQLDARAELVSLEASIPTVVLSASGSPNAQATIDGRDAKLGAEIELDPGEHVLIARAGAQSTEERIQTFLGEKRKAITLRLSGIRPTEAPADPEPGSIVPGVLLLSAGGAALLSGGVVGGLALLQADDVHARCGTSDGTCPASLRDEVEPDIDRVNLMGHVSTGMLIGGGALSAVGVVLMVVRPGGGAEDAPSVALAPSPGGLTLFGRF